MWIQYKKKILTVQWYRLVTRLVHSIGFFRDNPRYHQHNDTDVGTYLRCRTPKEHFRLDLCESNQIKTQNYNILRGEIYIHTFEIISKSNVNKSSFFD